MKFEELVAFAGKEHEKLVNHYGVKGNPKTRYTIFAKLVEEIGELSEAILASDSLQRRDKLEVGKESLEGELADTLLVTLILAKELDIDIEEALDNKIKRLKARKL
jgi:NTP pyrophosphatase (non-canonical NTP hydrolase)